MKELKIKSEAHEGLLEGIKELRYAVGSTMGPKGRNVLIETDTEYPFMTKDGVTVAKSISFPDRLKNMGAKLIIEAAENTDHSAGDGTTTSTVLAAELTELGLLSVKMGLDPIMMGEGMRHAQEELLKAIKPSIIEVKTKADIINVAKISSNNNEEIGNLIGEVYDKVGANGVVTVEDSYNHETTTEVVNGMQFDRGMVSQYFISDHSREVCEMSNPYILVYDGKIGDLGAFLGPLEALKAGGGSLVIIAHDIVGQALSSLIANRLNGKLDVVGIKAPTTGALREAILEDICVATGASIVNPGDDLDDISIFGRCESISVGKFSTTIVGGFGSEEEIEKRAEDIKKQLSGKIDMQEEKILKNRLAKLTGGVGVIYVGAPTEIEAKEKKDRIIDANRAVQSALEEGVVRGGGMALLAAANEIKIKKKVSDDAFVEGFNIVKTACLAPFNTIVRNAHKNAYSVREKIKESSYTLGYDAKRDKYVHMMSEGIIDPYKVTKQALINAISVASMIITTSCVVQYAEN